MKIINVAGAIIVKQGRILCVKRGPGRSLEGFWEFPGGKIEEGETAFVALSRELQEELNLKVDMSNEIFEISHFDYDFGRVELATIVCHIEANVEVQLTEHTEQVWLKTNELDQLNWAAADQAAVQKLIKEGIN